MNWTELAGRAADRLDLPDMLLSAAVARLVGRTRSRLAGCPPGTEADFVAGMHGRPIAEFTQAANQQHYELPPEFFALVLGPRRKYSSALYIGDCTLAEAEEAALAETCLHAELADGQSILELGCGWGSLSLFMAERYPASRIVAVSNAAPQREFIAEQAAARGLRNLTIITADMNDFTPGETFDRVVSVEMFEHMANWHALLAKLRGWLRPGGKLFLHVFSHRTTPYRFETEDRADWIAQYFFTGGLMPSHGMVRRFPDSFRVEQDWRWNGAHYRRTALDWLRNFDLNDAAIRIILAGVYGAEAAMWRRRWRIFFLATAGLFGDSRGAEWGVSHYRLAPAP